MYLTDYLKKSLTVNKIPRGVCLGIGFSLKTQAIKYLFCGTETHSAPTFALSFSTVVTVGEDVCLSRLRAVLPKACARIAIGTPVYNFDGAYVGEIRDAEIQNGTLFKLFLSNGITLPATAVLAGGDALILRKESPYPIGQRVPAPVLCLINDKTDGFVTKPLLRVARQKGALIKLTLSLPPFHFIGE